MPQQASAVHARELSMAEDQVARFSTWATAMGVFAPERASMDHRLRYAPDVRDVVDGLLESLSYRVRACSATLGSVAENTQSEFLSAQSEGLKQSFAHIGAEISHLNKISNTIRKASKETHVQKATDFRIEDEDGNDVEPLLRRVFEHNVSDCFPDKFEQLGSRREADHKQSVEASGMSVDDKANNEISDNYGRNTIGEVTCPYCLYALPAKVVFDEKKWSRSPEPPAAPVTPKWTPPSDPASRPIVILGAGVLGPRLAVMWASTGRPVVLNDVDSRALASAIVYIGDALTIVCAVRETRPGRVTTSTVLGESCGTDPWKVIEALPEDPEIKREMLVKADALVPEDCVLASNSSTWPITALRNLITRPERLLNTRYHLPPRNTYVELMTCGATDRDLISYRSERRRCAAWASTRWLYRTSQSASSSTGSSRLADVELIYAYAYWLVSMRGHYHVIWIL
ncbi:Fatty acid oxidation complex subunit alpha [Colletotrichum shisoi]|uniref:Fatty acid oxidation complex subunit alpha n=1 Tax=Colletotrichum shisoi TaxID=2078593 RepID=A0A5Q4BR07_9PEZI|nr:Fatty acid oxidation complex subunit alpha [Colletotrichum shisoi]